MRRAIAILLLILVVLTLRTPFAAENEANVLPIQKLYTEPTEGSNLVLDIPIEVKLLDVSENLDWYKVKIAYRIGPFKYEYIGWAHIPINDFILQKAETAK